MVVVVVGFSAVFVAAVEVLAVLLVLAIAGSKSRRKPLTAATTSKRLAEL